jgi:Xaa-Pro aminopeptidase
VSVFSVFMSGISNLSGMKSPFLGDFVLYWAWCKFWRMQHEKISMKKQKKALILWGATDFGMPHFSGDMLWRTGGFKIPDPTVLVDLGGKTFLFASELEFNRAKKEARVHQVVLLRQKDAVLRFLKDKGVTRVIVSGEMPFALVEKFKKHFRVASPPPHKPFYPRRALKTQKEIREISKVQRAAEHSVRSAMAYLAGCRIKGARIYRGSVAVTSEIVRKVIDDDLYRQGYFGIRSIVAGGVQAADPHNEGTGFLEPRVPIVMDIFPVSPKTHYWADMTRTVFKGAPAAPLEKMYMAVLRGQLRAIKKVKDGADGYTIWRDQVSFLKSLGYPTDGSAEPPRGFFHGVGHGVGIDLHEYPYIGGSRCILRSGHIVTVEPGLYYPLARGGIPAGGVRIEDLVVVTKKGCRNLTRFPKRLKDIVIP